MENYKTLDPLDYGLGKRVKIVEISNNHIGILKQRKSRIIMKDGMQIMDIVKQILSVKPQTNISLIIVQNDSNTINPNATATLSFLNDSSSFLVTSCFCHSCQPQKHVPK